MKFSSNHIGHEQEIIDLFTQTFTEAGGQEEGKTVGALTSNLLETTAENDLSVFTASEDAKLIGCIIFSRMHYKQDERNVFLLSPVAIASNQQGKGIGQKLINHGLKEVHAKGVHVALTYGDPNYYCKVGFKPMTEDFAEAPFRLSHPHGWLGQSITGEPFDPLQGSPTCVTAFNVPSLW